jgi:hypothetical protein
MEYTYNDLNNKLRQAVIDDSKYTQFPDCESVQEGTTVLKERKKLYLDKVKDVLKTVKVLKPYPSLYEQVLFDASEEVKKISEKGVSHIQSMFSRSAFYGEFLPDSNPMALFCMVLHMELIDNLVTVLSTNLLETNTFVQVPHSYLNYEPIDDFKKRSDNYENAWRALDELYELFDREIENYENIKDISLIDKPPIPTIDSQWEDEIKVQKYLKEKGSLKSIQAGKHPAVTTKSHLDKISSIEEITKTSIDKLDVEGYFKKIDRVESRLGGKFIDMPFTEKVLTTLSKTSEFKDYTKGINPTVRKASSAFLGRRSSGPK